MTQNCSKTQKCSNFWTRIVVKPRNLLHFWLKNYYISGFYYDSGSKVTAFLGFTTILVQKLLRFCFYYTFGYLLRFWGDKCHRAYDICPSKKPFLADDDTNNAYQRLHRMMYLESFYSSIQSLVRGYWP